MALVEGFSFRPIEEILASATLRLNTLHEEEHKSLDVFENNLTNILTSFKNSLQDKDLKVQNTLHRLSELEAKLATQNSTNTATILKLTTSVDTERRRNSELEEEISRLRTETVEHNETIKNQIQKIQQLELKDTLSLEKSDLLQKTVVELERKITEIESTATASQQEQQQVHKQQIADRDTKISTLEKELSTLIIKSKSLQSEHSSTLESLAENITQKETLSKENAVLRHTIAELTEIKERNDSEIVDLKNRLTMADNEKNALEALRPLQNDLWKEKELTKQLRGELEATELRIEELTLNHEQEMNSLRQKMMETEQKQRKETEIIQQELFSVQSDLNQVKTDKKKLEADMETLQSKSSFEQNRIQTESRKFEMERDRAYMELEDVQTTLHDFIGCMMKIQASDTDNKVTIVDMQPSTELRHSQNLDSFLSERDSQIPITNSYHIGMMAPFLHPLISTPAVRLRSLLSEQIRQTTILLDDKKALTQRLEKARKLLEYQKNSSETTLSTLTQEHEAEKARIEGIQLELESNLENRNKKVAELEDSINRLDSSILQHRDRISRLQHELEERESALSSLRKEKNIVEWELAGAAKENEMKSVQIQHLEGRLRTVEEREKKTQSDASRMELELEVIQVSLESVREERDKLDGLKGAAEAKERLEHEASIMKKEISELREERKERERKEAVLVGELAQLRQELSEVQEEKEGGLERVKWLEGERAKAAQKVREVEREREEVGERLREREKELRRVEHEKKILEMKIEVREKEERKRSAEEERWRKEWDDLKKNREAEQQLKLDWEAEREVQRAEMRKKDDELREIAEELRKAKEDHASDRAEWEREEKNWARQLAEMRDESRRMQHTPHIRERSGASEERLREKEAAALDARREVEEISRKLRAKEAENAEAMNEMARLVQETSRLYSAFIQLYESLETLVGEGSGQSVWETGDGSEKSTPTRHSSLGSARSTRSTHSPQFGGGGGSGMTAGGLVTRIRRLTTRLLLSPPSAALSRLKSQIEAAEREKEDLRGTVATLREQYTRMQVAVSGSQQKWDALSKAYDELYGHALRLRKWAVGLQEKGEGRANERRGRDEEGRRAAWGEKNGRWASEDGDGIGEWFPPYFTFEAENREEFVDRSRRGNQPENLFLRSKQ